MKAMPVSDRSDEPRRVVVFGASGGVGRHVVEQALKRGHEVVAVVRSPGTLTITDPGLTVVTAELTDQEAIGAAVSGADAVISALGPSLDRKAKAMPLVEGTRTIVAAMKAAGIRRFIGMATPSLRDPRDGRSVLGMVVPVMARLGLPRAYRELLEMSAIVTESGLDWTIARFTRPTDGPAKDSIRVGFLGHDKVGASITRADIATFLLDQVADRRFVGASPVISN